MFKSLRCFRKGHLFVDSRSEPGTQVCVRCRQRKPFEGLIDAGAPQTVQPPFSNDPVKDIAVG
jgi:hypothetical protein